jgi:hypothetical protein
MNHSVEITKEAAFALIGNDEETWSDYQDHQQTELNETSFYLAHGVRIAAIHNYISNVTQYYIQDVNA